LLIEAARKAAVADGLQPQAASSVPTTTSSTVKNENKIEPTTDKGDSDAVAAAMAMVASGNTVVKGAEKNYNESIDQKMETKGTTNGSFTMPVSAPQSSFPAPNSVPSVSFTKTAQQQLKPPVTSDPPSAGSAAHRLAVAAATSSTPTPAAATSKEQAVPQASSVPVVQRNGSGGPTAKKKGPPLRRGKWTSEEEAYANRLIVEFKAGLLPLTDGTTLRTFLSKLLNCDPMRISKKFVGSNCIGKQVFRRRTVDINRLTPDQIQQSRAELSELERRFLERVAQTNRLKSSGVNGNNSGNGNGSSAASSSSLKMKHGGGLRGDTQPNPPWLQPPNGFKHGTGASVATSALSSGTVNRAALAGRAMLGAPGNAPVGGAMGDKLSKAPGSSSGSAGILALMEMQRQNQNNLLQRQSQNNLMQNVSQSLSNQPSASNLLADAASAIKESNSQGSLSVPALAQIARNQSAARIAGLAAARGNSMTDLMLKTGLSRNQLSQLAREHQRNSSASISNMMERQSSLDALMSLDFQSLQSIDNLANLIQAGNSSQVPRTGMKNWSSDGNNSTNHLSSVAASLGANNNINNVPLSQQIPSESKMESLIRTLSNGALGNKLQGNAGSNATFNNLLQNVQGMNNVDGNNASNLFGNAASAVNLVNMLRTDSSTGLTALRVQDGLAQRNSSVDDFLSLVASGDIPHQDPHLLNVPLQSVLQQQHQNNQSGAQAAATILAQQQLLAQAANNVNGSSFSQKMASFGLSNNHSAASLLNQYTNSQNTNTAAAALAQQLQEARAASALATVTAQQRNSSTEQLKRKLSSQNTAGFGDLRPSKR